MDEQTKRELDAAMRECMARGFTSRQAKGAMANGTRVRKVQSEANDGHSDGAKGIVVGSMPSAGIEGMRGLPFYFVMWDDFAIPVGTAGWKLEEATEEEAKR